MAINNSSVQLIAAILDGNTVVMPTPGEAVEIPVLEMFNGYQKLAGGASLVNIKLGSLNRVKWLAVYGDVGVKIRTTETGSDLEADPFLFLANNVVAGMGISEVWVSNDDSEEHDVRILAAE